MSRHRRSQKSRPKGFTLIETLVIVLLVGVLGAVSAPSFSAMLDGIKVNQTVTELRTSFQDTQRLAIRRNQACIVQITPSSNLPNAVRPSIAGNCLTSGRPDLPAGIDLATNLSPSLIPLNHSLPVQPSPNTVEIKFSTLGSAEFSILSLVKLPLIPADPTAKVVAFIRKSPKVPKKCIAISSTLGLTRMGTYTGSTTPNEITDTGVCTALGWKEQ